jgi:hypothetical protein
MDLPTSVDPARAIGGEADWIDAELVAALAHHPLDAVETEYPHYVRSVESPEDTVRPAADHPVFYGCYDWHSAVHSHWALVRQLRLFEEHPKRAEIIESIDARFTPENVEQEVAYFEEHESFEKPYGWAWLLHLAGELSLWDSPKADEWHATLEPLETKIRSLVVSEFLPQDRPFRVGTHGNSAFALHCLLDYARTVGDDELERAVCETARAFYADDEDAPAGYEPLGWDFLSPTLVEADLLRRVYDHDEFHTWLDGFLPDLTTAPANSLLEPIEIETDTDEGIALHFVGLNVSRAWAMASLAETLADHPYADLLEASARDHAECGLAQAFTDDYAGSHWLSSFVLYLLTRNEDGIAVDS